MRAAVALLVAIGRDLIARRYQRTRRSCWEDGDAVEEGSDSLGLRQSCLKREKRVGRQLGWSEMACLRVALREWCEH